jgi:hypothetical protein
MCCLPQGLLHLHHAELQAVLSPFRESHVKALQAVLDLAEDERWQKLVRTFRYWPEARNRPLLEALRLPLEYVPSLLRLSQQYWKSVPPGAQGSAYDVLRQVPPREREDLV